MSVASPLPARVPVAVLVAAPTVVLDLLSLAPSILTRYNRIHMVTQWFF